MFNVHVLESVDSECVNIKVFAPYMRLLLFSVVRLNWFEICYVLCSPFSFSCKIAFTALNRVISYKLNII